ncbi:MAG: TRAP transporter substrate-binding protein DctP [Magnetococcales bacterium]|nr:TRAP transporter substrate-binding protein DctP [Magnetococcales bacterium]
MSEKTVRQILILLLLLVLLLLFVRLGKNLSQSLASGYGAQAGHAIRLRLGLGGSVNGVARAAAVRLSERMTVMSRGEVVLTVHPASELGGDERMLEQASRGELSMVVLPLAMLGRQVGAMRMFDLPFLFASRDSFHLAMDGALGRMLLDKARVLELEGLAFWEGGFRHFLADRPLLTPEAFAGVQMLEPADNRIRRELLAGLGVRFVGQSDPEGVQAREETLFELVGQPRQASHTHLTLSGHALAGQLLAVSRDAVEMLTARQQTILLDAAREVALWVQHEIRIREDGMVRELRDAGVTVHEPSLEARGRFQERLAYVARKFEERIGADVMARVSEWLSLHRVASEGSREILVGLDAQLSGESALVGLELKRGMMLAIDAVNAQGGLLGRKLGLVVRDNHGLATRGLDNLKFFAGLEDLVAVFGGQKSTVVAAEVEEVHRLELPLLLPWSAAQHLTENGFAPNQVFRLSLNDRWTAPFLARAALERGKRIALVLENSGWGHQFEKIIGRHLHGSGIRPELVHWVDNGMAGGFAPLLARFAEIGVDVVILVDTPDESIPFLLELSRTLPHVAVVSHWGVLGAQLTPEERRILGGLDLVFPQTFFATEAGNRAGERLLQESQAFFHLDEADPPVNVGSGFAQAYDLVHLFAAAVRAAGSTERAAVRSALERLPVYRGVIRQHAPPFDAQRHDALGSEDYRLGRIGPDGSVVPAESRR